MPLESATRSMAGERFRHGAVFYRGLDGLVASLRPFVLEGVRRDEPVMVALLPDRLEALRDALGAWAEPVTFVDMTSIGGNPARIIPAWRDFVDEASTRGSFRGVGEPIWAGRREAEIAECHLHESLLNVAFDDGPGWQLLCPYDEGTLPGSVVHDAKRTHPDVWTSAGEHQAAYEGHDHARQSFSERLQAPPGITERFDFEGGDLASVRAVVARCGAEVGIGRDVLDDVALAAHELAANSVLHGGGRGTLLTWADPSAFVVEVRDSGRITDPMVGREAAAGYSEGGRGLWMANHLCDLVQVRSGAEGTVVRLHTWR